jgi:molybdate transport system substrate-binding protein
MVVAGCGSAGSTSEGPVPTVGQPSRSPGDVKLQVYGAASLRNVLVELAGAYEAGHPGTTLAISTDSSAALATKIEQGAPADVFLSADTKNAQRLVDGRLASGGVTIFAANELALIVPADNPAGIGGLSDLATPGVKVIAAGDEVPIAGYTVELLGNLAALDTYPDDFAARYEANVVSREDNVGGIVAKVSLGEGDAGIVYLTDARAARDVQVIAIPREHNVTASYGAVVPAASANAGAAAEFLAWLTSDEAQDILASFGFTPVA